MGAFLRKLSAEKLESAQLLVSVLLVLGLAGLYAKQLSLLTDDGLPLVWPLSAQIAVGLALVLWLATGRRLSLLAPVFVLGLILILASDYPGRKFAYYAVYSHRISRGAILCLGLSLAGGIFALGIKNAERSFRLLFSIPILLALQLLLSAAFLHYAGGRLIFSDDHPSFLYRLQLLMAEFPHLPFYNPEWNGGIEARDFFSTGVLNVFFFSWPLLRLWGSIHSLEDARIYTYLLPYLFVVIVPWSVYFAAQIFGLSRQGAVLAAIFALGPSLEFFEWTLKFGTVAFSLSCGLTSLALALCGSIFIAEEDPPWWHIAAAMVATSLCFTWSLSTLSFIPLAVLSLVYVRGAIAAGKGKKILVFIIGMLLLNAPWVYVWIREANVFAYVARTSLPGSSTVTVSNHPARELGFAKFQGILQQINPLIYFLAIPGFLALGRGRARIFLAASILWLMLVAGTADLVRPQLELRRMLVPAGFLMAILAAAGLLDLLRKFAARAAEAGAAVRVSSFGAMALLFGFWAGTPLNISEIYRNFSDQHFIFATSEVPQLIEVIKKFGGTGRTFFLSFVLHQLESSAYDGYDGGHLAPLTKFTGHSLYASHFMHARWSTIDPIPRPYLDREEEGVEEFLDLMNVTSVVTFRKEWRKYCNRQPERYELVFQNNHLWFYTRKSDHSGYFQKGTGEIKSSGDDFVEVAPYESESVLKFRYQPELQVSPAGARIVGEPVFIEDLGGGHEQQVFFVKLIVDDKEALARRQVFTFGYHVK